MDIIGWLLTINSLIGAIFNAQKSIIGFYFWAIGNFGWIMWSLSKGLYHQTFLWFTYFLISIYGIYKWNKEK